MLAWGGNVPKGVINQCTGSLARGGGRVQHAEVVVLATGAHNTDVMEEGIFENICKEYCRLSRGPEYTNTRPIGSVPGAYVLGYSFTKAEIQAWMLSEAVAEY